MQPELRPIATAGEPALATRLPEAEGASTDWRERLPLLTGRKVTLRELRLADAPTLLAMLGTQEVERFISPPPTTVGGFERFILWTARQREVGRYVCFGIVPEGQEHAVGVFQIRQLEPTFTIAEWGFAIGVPFWGAGLFTEGARLVVDFAFETIGIDRLEARSAVENGRGNGALAKVGAVKEGVLRKSFLKDGRYLDQTLWAIVREDWMQSKAVWGEKIH